MSSVIFSSAMRVISQVFNFLQTSNLSATSNLINDAFQVGIDNATSLGEGFIIVPGSNNTSLNPSISITTGGLAYNNLGNRIFISPSDTTVYNSANPTTTTNDGTGTFVLTPQSTGVVNISVTQSVVNYIWVEYLSTIDTSAFTLNKITQAKLFYKQTDGYSIVITTVNIPPTSSAIFLGTVNQTGGGLVTTGNISQTGRTYFNILPNVVPIVTAQANRSDATAIYNPASTYVLETHIKAVGTGIVNATNPHGTSLQDLGVGTLDTVVGHRQLEHGNGIIAGVPGTPYPATSAMSSTINIVNPGSDYLTIHQLLSTEFAIVNGTAYNVTDIFGSIPSDAHIFFPSTSGTYNVYWDSIVKLFSQTTADISSDNTKLWLCTVTYTFVGTGPSDHNSLSALTDRRRIGSTTHLLQRWITSARPGSGLTQPNSGEFGFNLTTNLLEYWDGTAWQQPVNSSSNSVVPAGAMLDFAGSSAPTGFLLCDGSAVSRTTFANLFSTISTIWGPGDGSTTFNLPDFRRRVAVGSGGVGTGTLGNTIGNTGGTETTVHTHTENLHTHTIAHDHETILAIVPPSTIVIDGASGFGTTSRNHIYQFAGTSNTTGPSAFNYSLTGPSSAPNSGNQSDTGMDSATLNTIQPSAIVTKIIKF